MNLPNNDINESPPSPDLGQQTESVNIENNIEGAESLRKGSGSAPQDDVAVAQPGANQPKVAQPAPSVPSQDNLSQPAPAQPLKGGSTEPYIKAAENVIAKDKNDPYQEEEDHEDVQVQYLKDRFGKDIKK